MKIDLRESSLIAFTLLVQLAVGAFWMLMAADLLFVYRFGVAHTETIPLGPLLGIVAAMAASLGIALLHLGSPRIAYRAIANLRSSWLSREILTTNVFAAAVAAFTAAHWLALGWGPMRAGLAWLAVLCGGALLYAMSRVYTLRTVPIWNTAHTPLSFFLAALILGTAVLGVTFAIGPSQWRPPDANSGAAIVPIMTATALSFLGIELLLVSARIASFLSGSIIQKQAIGRMFEKYRPVFLARLIAGLSGAAVLIAMLARSQYGPAAYSLGFALILTAEVLDRFLFYAAREATRL